MKKITVLLASLLFTITVFSQDHSKFVTNLVVIQDGSNITEISVKSEIEVDLIKEEINIRRDGFHNRIVIREYQRRPTVFYEEVICIGKDSWGNQVFVIWKQFADSLQKRLSVGFQDGVVYNYIMREEE